MTSRVRPFVASLAFLGLAALFALASPSSWDWCAAVVIATPLTAALACHARALGVHVVVRAVAWLHVIAFAPFALIMHVLPCAVGCVLGAVALVALGRDAYEQRAEAAGFTPIAYRRVFLAASTAAVAVAIVLGLYALLMLGGNARERADGVLTLALAAGLIAASAGVLRMRALGVVIGVLTAAVAAGVSTAVLTTVRGLEGETISAMVWTMAVPCGLAFVAPVAWSRVWPARPAPARRSVPLSSVLAIGIAGLAAVCAPCVDPR